MRLSVLFLVLCLVVVCVYAHKSKGKHSYKRKGVAKGHKTKGGYKLGKGKRNAEISSSKQNSLQKKKDKKADPKKPRRPKGNDKKKYYSPAKTYKKQRKVKKPVPKKRKPTTRSLEKRSSKEMKNKKKKSYLIKTQTPKEEKAYSGKKKGHSHERKTKPNAKGKDSKENKSKEKYSKEKHSRKYLSKEKHSKKYLKKEKHSPRENNSKERKKKKYDSKESNEKKEKGVKCILQKCSSKRNRRSTCVNKKLTEGKVISIAVVKKMSRKKCQLNKSYGFTSNAIWASRGCRAIFKVCSKKGVITKDKEGDDEPNLPRDKTKENGYIGCFKDSRNRLLKTAYYRSHRMTVNICMLLCKKKGTKFFGVENGVECFCGNKIIKRWKTSEMECKMPCKGNKKEKCGGIWRVSVYTGDSTRDDEAGDAPELPKDQPKKNGYVGCFKDSSNRLLKTVTFRSHRMTVGLCRRLCSKRRTKYFGVENGVECFCGNDITKHKKIPERECKMPCRGNRKQKCGGIWRISVYKGKLKATPKCHKRARYRRGKCVCRRGFYGDGINSCEKTCTCMASGDPHYKTYDGQMIHFMGTCKYILTKTTKDEGQCSFSVEVKNEHRGRNMKVSYTRTVDLKIYGKKIRLSQGKKVSIDGQKKFLPVTENDNKIKVFRSGRFVQVWTDCGIKVNYDGVHAVYVVTPSRFKRNLEGLCGDCNGKKDDFKTRKGRDVSKLKNKYALIGDSYSVEDDSDDPTTRCETEDVPTQCEPKMNNLVNEPDICGDLQSVNGRFAACVKAIPLTAREYYKSCVMDMCSYEGEVRLLNTVKCSSLESFVEECAENGIEIKWRTDKFCPLKCKEPNMVYKTSGSGCPATCFDPKATEKCTIEDREGCFCKPGFVLSDNKCIKSDQCGCKDTNGDYFPVGSKKGSKDCSKEYVCKKLKRGTRFVQVSNGRKCHRKALCRYDVDGVRSCVCKKGYIGDGYKKCKALCGLKYKCHKSARCRNGQCVCKRGLYGDGINSCEKMCTCTASGDPHYRTFDGQMIHFMGDCKYTLAKSTNDIGKCSFNVEVKNFKRRTKDRVSFTRYVEVQLGDDVIQLLQGGKIQVNKQQVYLPFKAEQKTWQVYTNGNYHRLKTSCDISVLWNGKSVVQVVMPKKYGNSVTGICGNCNGKKDDYRTKEGLDVSRNANKYSLIGNSYQVEMEKDGTASKRCKTDDKLPPCSRKMVKRLQYDDRCGFLKLKNDRSPFKDCVNALAVTATEYFESCNVDACAYSDDLNEQSDVICMNLAAFAEECLIGGYKVKWRTSRFCPIKCGKNMRYSEAVSGCPATCADPEDPRKCKDEPTEGCECLPGYLLSNDQCVPQDDCGCTKNGEYYPLNTTLVSVDCTSVDKCVSRNGESIFVKIAINIKCHSNGLCGLQDGQRKCVCANGYVGDGVRECRRPTTSTTTTEPPEITVTEQQVTTTQEQQETTQLQTLTITDEEEATTERPKSTTPIPLNDEPSTVTVKDVKTTTKPPPCDHPARSPTFPTSEEQLGTSKTQNPPTTDMEDHYTAKTYNTSSFETIEELLKMIIEQNQWFTTTEEQVEQSKTHDPTCQNTEEQLETSTGQNPPFTATIENTESTAVNPTSSTTGERLETSKAGDLSTPQDFTFSATDKRFESTRIYRQMSTTTANQLATATVKNPMPINRKEHLDTSSTLNPKFEVQSKQMEPITAQVLDYTRDEQLETSTLQDSTSTTIDEQLEISLLQYSTTTTRDEQLETSTLQYPTSTSRDEQLETSTLQYPTSTTRDEQLETSTLQVSMSTTIKEQLETSTLQGQTSTTTDEQLETSTIHDQTSTHTDEQLETSTLQYPTSTTRDEHLETSTLQGQTSITTDEQLDRSTMHDQTSTHTDEQLETSTLQGQTSTTTDEQLETSTLQGQTSTTTDEQLETSTMHDQTSTHTDEQLKTSTLQGQTSTISDEQLETSTLQYPTSTTRDEQLETSTLQVSMSTTIKELLETSTLQGQTSTTDEQLETSTIHDQTSTHTDEQLETSTLQGQTSTTTDEQLETSTLQDQTSTHTDEQLETSILQGQTSTTTDEQLETSTMHHQTSTHTDEQLKTSTLQGQTSTISDEQLETSTLQGQTSTISNEQLESTTYTQRSMNTRKQLEASTSRPPKSTTTQELNTSTQVEKLTTQTPASSTTNEKLVTSKAPFLDSIVDKQLETSTLLDTTFTTTNKQLETPQDLISPTIDEPPEPITYTQTSTTTAKQLETSTSRPPTSTTNKNQFDQSNAHMSTTQIKNENLETPSTYTKTTRTTEKQLGALTSRPQKSTTTEEQLEESTSQITKSPTKEKQPETSTAYRQMSTTAAKQLSTLKDKHPKSIITKEQLATSTTQNPKSSTTNEQLKTSDETPTTQDVTFKTTEKHVAKPQESTAPNLGEQLEPTTHAQTLVTRAKQLEASNDRHPTTTTTEKQPETSQISRTTAKQFEIPTTQILSSKTTEQQLDQSTALEQTSAFDQFETSTAQNAKPVIIKDQLKRTSGQTSTTATKQLATSDNSIQSAKYTNTEKQFEAQTIQTQMDEQLAISTARLQTSTTIEQQFEASDQIQVSAKIGEQKELLITKEPTSTTILMQLLTSTKQGPITLEDRSSTKAVKDITTAETLKPCDQKEPECSVIVRHDSCGTETVLTGTCAFSNQFTNQCQYMVSTGILTNGDYIADVTIDGKKTRLKSGQILKDCTKFAVKGSLLVITEDTCERCILQFVRNMVPRNQCVKF